MTALIFFFLAIRNVCVYFLFYATLEENWFHTFILLAYFQKETRFAGSKNSLVWAAQPWKNNHFLSASHSVLVNEEDGYLIPGSLAHIWKMCCYDNQMDFRTACFRAITENKAADLEMCKLFFVLGVLVGMQINTWKKKVFHTGTPLTWKEVEYLFILGKRGNEWVALIGTCSSDLI